MFERFTDRARQAVVCSRDEARKLGRGSIGPEHLLLGLLAEGGNVAAWVLHDLGLDHAAVAAEVQEMTEAGEASFSDADALRTIGIDLEAVRGTIEATFGPGALERPAGRRRRRWRPWQRTCGSLPVPDNIRLTSEAKRALERSLREALKLRHGYVGAEHLLLGLVAEPDSAATRVLARLGVDPARVRTRVLSAIGRVA